MFLSLVESTTNNIYRHAYIYIYINLLYIILCAVSSRCICALVLYVIQPYCPYCSNLYNDNVRVNRIFCQYNNIGSLQKFISVTNTIL